MKEFTNYVPLVVAILGLCGTLITIFAPLMYQKIGKEKAEKVEKALKTTLEIARLAVEISEQIHKQKGQGPIKKEEALAFVKNFKLPLSLTDVQIGALVDNIVQIYNETKWAKTMVAEVAAP